MCAELISDGVDEPEDESATSRTHGHGSVDREITVACTLGVLRWSLST